MKNKILLAFLLLFSSIVFAQNTSLKVIEQNNSHFKAIEIEVKKNTLYSDLPLYFNASSITLESISSHSFNKSYIILNSEKFNLTKDEEQSDVIEQIANRNTNQSTQLYIPASSFNTITFFSGDLEGMVRINLMYAAPLEQPVKSTKKKSAADCSVKPESIDQEVWRAGLPPPTVPPTGSQVKHIILHHAAGSNTNPDHTATVRNYYLLHTQTNGWDDMGYNYLVAPDGTIFDGRDGGSIGDDNVIGAHMCARNTNTMGICLLGNYHNTGFTPADTALSSINQLITWKLWKEQLLNPYDSSLHPVNNPVGYLGVIAGHRQGCNAGYTSCPGDQYFEVIEPKVRAQVSIMLANCEPLGINPNRNNKTLIYPNPWNNGSLKITHSEMIQEVIMLNMLGKEVFRSEAINDFRYELTDKNLSPGNYILMIKTSKYIDKQIISKKP